MRAVKRVVTRLVLLLFLGLGLLWPVVFGGVPSGGGATSDPVVFSDVRADFAVDNDGLMRADEIITAEFPGGRHGIFRF